MKTIKLFIICLITLLPMNAMAENELAYVVLHFCQKHLAEKRTADWVDDMLHGNSRHTPSTFSKISPEVIEVLAEEYKRDSLLQNYFDYAYAYAIREKLDYAQFERFVNESDNIDEAVNIQASYNSIGHSHYVAFYHVALDNVKENKDNNPLVAEAPQWWVDAYKDVVDSLALIKSSGLIKEHEDVRNQFIKWYNYPEDYAEERTNVYIAYLQKNIHAFYTNLLFRLFPNEKLMNSFLRGNRIAGLSNFCSAISHSVFSEGLSSTYYSWGRNKDNYKKAKQIAKDRGLKDISYTVKETPFAYTFNDMGLLDFSFGNYDELPSWFGDKKAVIRFLRSNLRYPKIARDNNVQEDIQVSFFVEKDGSITNVKVISKNIYLYYRDIMDDKDLESDEVKMKRKCIAALEDEALRVVKKMPKWNPAKKDGVVVGCEFFTNVGFRIHKEMSKEEAETIRHYARLMEKNKLPAPKHSYSW